MMDWGAMCVSPQSGKTDPECSSGFWTIANIERRNQDYGTTPLVSTVISCSKEAISILVARGANTEGAMQVALRGLAGGFEDTGIGPDGYKEIAEFELIAMLNDHLPIPAYATPPLVKAVRQQGADIKVNDAVEIDSVLYLGDEGGIACAIGLWGGKTAVVTSLTHLRIDCSHPLAERIQAYQSRRSQHLRSPIGPMSRSSRKSRANLATKLKRKRKARQ